MADEDVTHDVSGIGSVAWRGHNRKAGPETTKAMVFVAECRGGCFDVVQAEIHSWEQRVWKSREQPAVFFEGPGLRGRVFGRNTLDSGFTTTFPLGQGDRDCAPET